MLATLYALITSKLAGPIAAGVAVLLAIALAASSLHLHMARSELAGARKALSAAQQDLGTCRATTAALDASLSRQNEAVAGLKAQADARQAQSAKAVQSARSVAESYRRNAEAISARKRGPDACADADRLILENAR